MKRLGDVTLTGFLSGCMWQGDVVIGDVSCVDVRLGRPCVCLVDQPKSKASHFKGSGGRQHQRPACKRKLFAPRSAESVRPFKSTM